MYEFSRRYSKSNEVYCKFAVSRCAIAIRAISGVEFNAEQLLREDQDPEDQGELQVTLYNSTQLRSSLRTSYIISLGRKTQALSIQLSPHIPPIVLKRHVGMSNKSTCSVFMAKLGLPTCPTFQAFYSAVKNSSQPIDIAE